MEKLRMGLIGCGGMMKNHARAVNMVDSVEIVAVCDIIKERAENVASALNDPYVTTDYHDMVDKVDAVLVALPHDLHFECGMFFAFNNKHILMEKPLCNSEEECLRLIKMCEDHKVTLMCGYPVRFWPGIIKLKEMVDSGDYGEIIQMSVWTEQLTGEGIDGFKDGRPDWSMTSRLGGGQLFSHGCHYIDIMLWFLGNPVSGAHLGTRNGTPWMLKEGTSALVMKFESGALGYHGATWGARGSRMGYDFQIQTEKGMIEYQHYAGQIKLYDQGFKHQPGVAENPHYKVLWERGTDVSKETQYEIAHFAECCRTGATPITNGYSTLQGLRVIWKLYDAEQHGVVADLRGLGLNQK
ncbi:MAG: Gfo/Idh/MocA family oxidoreductase [Clostridia bacterium]|nr:Gfo/Idh/MocA family oxidoreductase [Clostridia bacterium]